MCSPEDSAKDLDEEQLESIGKLVSDIRTGKLQGAQKIALATISLLEQMIDQSENATASELCGVVRGAGRRLWRALPLQPAAANTARRVLRAIRDETRAAHTAHPAHPAHPASAEGAGDSLQRLVAGAAGAAGRRATLVGGAEAVPGEARAALRDQLAELRAEAAGCGAALALQARAHLAAGEVVLLAPPAAHGPAPCPLLLAFLRAAPRAPRLLLAAGADPRRTGAAAARLAAVAPLTVVSSAAVFALMPRVNKVVVSCVAALGGGGVVCAAGARLAASAAQRCHVPVLALAPLWALSPLPAAAPRAVPLGAPAAPAPAPAAHCYAPLHDYLPPELITLFITNLGGSSPSYIYRLLSELYDPRDHSF